MLGELGINHENVAVVWDAENNVSYGYRHVLANAIVAIVSSQFEAKQWKDIVDKALKYAQKIENQRTPNV